MYAQFALVIAATALLSAINAATLKPTQCALWLRRAGAAGAAQRRSIAASTRVYDARRARLCPADRAAWSRRSGVMVGDRARRSSRRRGLRLHARRRPASCRSRTRAICWSRVQLPDGASLERTQKALDRGRRDRAQDAGRRPGRHHRRHLARSTTTPRSPTPASPTSCSRTGASAARAQDLLLAVHRPQQGDASAIEEARVLVLPPPPIQGIGNAAGFTMQVELRDGSFDFAKLQSVANAIVEANAQTQSSIQRVLTPFRADAPQYRIEVDRVKAQTLRRHRRSGVLARSPAISARPMSTSSTSSAACSRSMCRPTRSSACGREDIAQSRRCATRTAA